MTDIPIARVSKLDNITTTALFERCGIGKNTRRVTLYEGSMLGNTPGRWRHDYTSF